MSRYTFGNTVTAAERLRRIAEFFDPLAKEFIRSNLRRPIGKAADLGCGPGYTTRMLAEAAAAKRTLWIDQSDFFIEEARRTFPTLKFRQADVTRMSDGDKFDLIYCRFLLSHLLNLDKVIASWLNCLQPGGMLILDEFEDIITEVPVFKNYIHISGELVASQGANLFVGKVLDEAVKNFRVTVNQTNIIPVEDWRAAGWFHGNTIGPWKEEKYIQTNFERSKMQDISDELLHIHNAQENVSRITWKMKRIALSN